MTISFKIVVLMDLEVQLSPLKILSKLLILSAEERKTASELLGSHCTDKNESALHEQKERL